MWATRLASTPTAPTSAYTDVEYAPFGEAYGLVGNSDLNFTGQNQDTLPSPSVGEYDFLFREYNPQQGRWISPDPAGMGAANVANPQTWNRYAYVANGPLNAVDSSGLLLSDCQSCNFFNDALSAVNQQINWSVDAQTAAFFGNEYYDLPGHGNPIATGQISYLQSIYGGRSVTAGTNGVTISFYANFWRACSKDVPEYCLGQDSINLFQFLDQSFAPEINLGSMGTTTNAANNMWNSHEWFRVGHVLLKNLSGPQGVPGTCAEDRLNGNTICDFQVVHSCTNTPTWTTNGVVDSTPGEAGWWATYVCMGGTSHCMAIPGTATKTTNAGPAYCPNP
jgi:RHS repeat-associated protein